MRETCCIIILAVLLATGYSALHRPRITAHATFASSHPTLAHLKSPPRRYDLTLVADGDRRTRHPKGEFRATVLNATLTWDAADRVYDLQLGTSWHWSGHASYKARGMELSALTPMCGRLYTVCDITGMLYTVESLEERPDALVPRQVLINGDGTARKPLKGEWMAVRDGYLYIGSTGKPWISGEDWTTVLNRDAEWIKVMDAAGHLRHLDWGHVYHRIREALEVRKPGWIWIEAASFVPHTRTWVFGLRKLDRSQSYHEDNEWKQGANKLVFMDDETMHVQHVVDAVPFDRKWGASAMALLPFSMDEDEQEMDDESHWEAWQHTAALQVHDCLHRTPIKRGDHAQHLLRQDDSAAAATKFIHGAMPGHHLVVLYTTEVGDHTATRLTVIDLRTGDSVLRDGVNDLSVHHKFEGVAVTGVHANATNAVVA